jgi:hypothetical protein
MREAIMRLEHKWRRTFQRRPATQLASNGRGDILLATIALAVSCGGDAHPEPSSRSVDASQDSALFEDSSMLADDGALGPAPDAALDTEAAVRPETSVTPRDAGHEGRDANADVGDPATDVASGVDVGTIDAHDSADVPIADVVVDDSRADSNDGNDGADALGWSVVATVRGADAQLLGAETLYASSRLEVSWTDTSGGAADHYVILATDSVAGSRVTTTAPHGSTLALLTGLKAATTYSITVFACVDVGCTVSFRSLAATGTTAAEHWQLQGTGNNVSGVTRIVSDGNAKISATRFGTESTAPRVQLYYGPSGGAAQQLSVAVTAEVLSATSSASYLHFEPRAGTGLMSPQPAATLVGSVGTGHAVPLSDRLGNKVRLFFEAAGADGKTRIMTLDSADGQKGRDFNTGSSGVCSATADYTTGGGCAPTVAVGVDGDSNRGNAKLAHARQHKVGFRVLDDFRWDEDVGTFMVFTTDKIAGCTTDAMNHGYAVWDGTQWNVQYALDGCPKLFRSAQAAFPMHLGGARFKLYYGDPAVTTGKLGGPLPFLGPKKLIYADGAQSGDVGHVDFEDWESQVSARDVVFIWPSGDKLDATAEGYIDDYHFLAPTGDLSLQIMYLAMTDGVAMPFAAAARLINP